MMTAEYITSTVRQQLAIGNNCRERNSQSDSEQKMRDVL